MSALVKGLISFIVVAGAAAVGLPLAFDKEGHDAPEIAPDHIDLELSGPEAAPLVVMIHGVSGPKMVWDKLVPLLNGNGFRTLRFDLWGRGGSGRPADGRYDLAAYEAELDQALAQAKIPAETPFYLVGSSMGCMVSSEYATLHPARLKGLVLIGPAGFPLLASPLAKLLELDGVGDWAMRAFGDRNLADHNRKYFHAPERFPDFQRRFEDQLRVKGSKHAILMTVRNVPLQSFLDGYDKVGALRLPKLVVWGKQDQAFPYDNAMKLMPRLPEARLVSVDNAGHLPQYEQDQVVGPAVLGFLREHP